MNTPIKNSLSRLPYQEVIGTDIRACVSMLFDNVATYNALMSTG